MPVLKIQEGRIQINSLEIFASARCNLRCEHCAASAQYVMEHHFPDLAVLERTLSYLTQVMHSKQVKVLGGEPLLNKDLPSLLEAVRRTGFCDRIRVCTNGVLLGRMPDSFWKQADIVEVSLYPGSPGSPTEKDLQKYGEIAAGFGTIFEFNKVTHFQEALLTAPIQDAKIVQRIFDECWEAHVWPCHSLEGSVFMLCSRVHNLERRLSYLGYPEMHLVKEAGLEISDRKSLFDELVEYMERRQPFLACQFCLGTSGRRIKNQQLPAEVVHLHRTKDDRPFELQLLDFKSSPLTPRDQPGDDGDPQH